MKAHSKEGAELLRKHIFSKTRLLVLNEDGKVAWNGLCSANNISKSFIISFSYKDLL